MARTSDHRVRAIAHLAEKIGKMGDGATARQLQAEVNRLSRGAAALDSVNANRSPLDTEAAHAVKVAKMARKFDSEVTAVINRAGQVMRDGHQEVQRRIDEKVDLKPDNFAMEIRTRFFGLDASAKSELVNRLVKENRGPELAAIVKAPSVLTGISDEQRGLYEQAIISTHAAAELDDKTRIDDALKAVLAATGTAANFVKDLTDPNKLAKIEQGEAAAIAAGEAFNQSLQ